MNDDGRFVQRRHGLGQVVQKDRVANLISANLKYLHHYLSYPGLATGPILSNQSGRLV
jgi:hypothetical protein